MRDLPAALQAHLASGATTLAWCWRVTRRDGVKLGFTDHDRTLVFDGTTFEAAAGFTASEIKDSVGLSVDNLEVSSALSSATLGEDDLAAGVYDDARVEIWRVNWTDPIQRVLVRTGSLGEVRRAGASFTAEIRGLAHYLQQPRGRLFQYGCDAELGDTRCGVDLERPDLASPCLVVGVIGGRRLSVDGLSGFPDGWFERGLLRVVSGGASGFASEIREHARSGANVTLEVWQQAHAAIAPGDALHVLAGCDKTLATCRERFANAVNYRGCPHMPGNDFVTGYVRRRT